VLPAALPFLGPRRFSGLEAAVLTVWSLSGSRDELRHGSVRPSKRQLNYRFTLERLRGVPPKCLQEMPIFARSVHHLSQMKYAPAAPDETTTQAVSPA
jgi:hypothetical protein